MKQLTGACIIGQSGGPTAVINASAQGVIQTALKADCITHVLGAAHGIKGVLEDKLYDMGQEGSVELGAGKDAPNFGEAKNSWLTGTAAWTFLDVSQ